MIKGSITAFYALSLQEFHMNLHSHDSFEIMYVTGGSCIVYCDDDKYTLAPNHFIFIRSGIPHRLEICREKPCSILNLEFILSETDGSIPLEGLAERWGEFRSLWNKMPDCFCGQDLRNLGYSLKDLISHIQKSSAEGDFLLQLIMTRTMAELAYSIVSGRNEAGYCYIRKACDYLNQHFHSGINIPELASYIGISKSYLQALFSKAIGCSIMEYVVRKRMEEAVFLLVNSTFSIIDISTAVGFNSRQHFSHTFTKHYGVSPQAYRSTHRRVLEPDTGQKRYILDGKRLTYRNFSK